MFITYVLPTIATLLFLYAAMAYRFKIKKINAAEEQARLQEEKDEKIRKAEEKEYDQIIKEELVINRNTTFEFPPRISGMIQDYHFLWFKCTEGGRVNTYARLGEMMSCEQLTREEMDSINLYEELLKDLRTKAYHGVPKPRGYRVFIDFIEGEILQYNIGILNLSDRNQGAASIAQHADGNMYIEKLYFSINLSTELMRVYDYSTKEGMALFKKQILDNENLCTLFGIELERLEHLKEELQKYNLHHRSIQKVKGTSRMEYIPSDDSTEADTERPDFENAPVKQP